MEEKSVLEHLSELRFRLLVITIVFIGFFVVGFLASDHIMNRVNSDLFSPDVHLIVTHPLEYVLAKINIGIFFALLLSIPLLLYHMFAFMKPGLNERERKIAKLSIVSGSVLFVTGFLFSYFILLRVIIWFFSSLASSAGIANLWSVNYFVNFVFLTCITMGVIFELPVISLALVKAGIIDAKSLSEKRGYAVILIFVVAAVITPPDPVTQVLVALPMIILFEISVLVARMSGRLPRQPAEQT